MEITIVVRGVVESSLAHLLSVERRNKRYCVRLFMQKNPCLDDFL